MSSVMIRCPETGFAVSTQIETEASVLRQLPKIAARMACPACGREHVWMTTGAWLEDESQVQSQVESQVVTPPKVA